MSIHHKPSWRHAWPRRARARLGGLEEYAPVASDVLLLDKIFESVGLAGGHGGYVENICRYHGYKSATEHFAAFESLRVVYQGQYEWYEEQALS